MYKLTIILMIILSILLIVIVLLQNSKNDGASNSFGSMGGNQLIGVKKTTNALEQITWGLGIALFVLAILATLILKQKHQTYLNSVNVTQAADRLTLPSNSQKDDESNKKSAEENS